MAKIVSDGIIINLSKIAKNDADEHAQIWDDSTIAQITKVAEKLFEGTGVIVEVEKPNSDED